MMFQNGVFVPPGCPTLKIGELPDLRTEPFGFHVTSSRPDNSGHFTQMEIIVSFGAVDKHGEYRNGVESAALFVPADSTIAEKVRRITEGRANDEYLMVKASANARVDRVRKAFCDRVANCRGVVGGECWALGVTGVREVIEQA